MAEEGLQKDKMFFLLRDSGDIISYYHVTIKRTLAARSQLRSFHKTAISSTAANSLD
jgi:hypothetical protein